MWNFTWAFSWTTIVDISWISRTLIIASGFWFTACASPYSQPLSTWCCALRPWAPFLPFSSCNIKRLENWSKFGHKHYYTWYWSSYTWLLTFNGSCWNLCGSRTSWISWCNRIWGIIKVPQDNLAPQWKEDNLAPQWKRDNLAKQWKEDNLVRFGRVCCWPCR